MEWVKHAIYAQRKSLFERVIWKPLNWIKSHLIFETAAQACGLLLHCHRDGFWCGTWKLKFSGACKSGNWCRPCCSVRDVFFCKRPCSLQTIGNLKKTLNLLKICSPRLCSSCITLTKSNVQIVLFAVALVWFNFCCDCSILCLSVWMFFFVVAF